MVNSEHVNGFWFGTQSLLCMNAKLGSLPDQRRIHRRSVVSSSSSGFPTRSSLRYVHRLVFYRGLTFEWGTGTRGYHFDRNGAVSVRDCDVTWERRPAGESDCPVSRVVDFTLRYRSRFGPYNLLTNNCHHFANRVSKLLTDGRCVVSGERTEEDGVVGRGEKMLWSLVNYFLSLSSRGTEPDREVDTSLVVT